MELFEHQAVNSEILTSIIEKNRCAVDMSEMGTGKTYTALDVARRLNAPILVICPKSIISGWVDAIVESGFKERFDVINYEKIRINKEGNYWLPRGSAYQWIVPIDTLIIFDEAHRLKSPRSKIAKICRCIENRVLLLSATLAISPLELRCAGTLLGLFKWTDFFAWCQLNGCQRNVRFGGFVYNHTSGIWRSNIQRFSVSTKLNDVKDDMKDNLIQNKVVEIDKLGLINSCFNAYVELVKKRDNASAHIESLQYALQMCELEKVEYFKQCIIDNHSQQYKSIVFVNYKETQMLLYNALEKQCMDTVMLNGDTVGALRHNVINRWLANELDCLILTYGTCGEGVSLDDKIGGHRRVVLLSPCWSAIKMKQALGRAYRASTKSDVVQQIVFAKNTLEERVAESVRAKILSLDELTNDCLFDLEQ